MWVLVAFGFVYIFIYLIIKYKHCVYTHNLRLFGTSNAICRKISNELRYSRAPSIVAIL